jgi:nitroreductase
MTETTSTSLTPARSEVERAVAFGVRAPSIHNTQPWRWIYRPGVLELDADRSRQLPALDPDGRSLLLSCGAALELARLGFAAAGWPTEVDRLPDPDRPDLLARIHTLGRTAVQPATVERAKAAERRRTERRPFLVEPVADEAIRALLAVATDVGSYAYAVQRADEQLDLAVVFSWADGVEMSEPAYRAELAHWTRAADAADGVPAAAIPHVSAGAPRHTDVPMRDFEAGVTGGEQLVELVDERPHYIVLFSMADDRAARLRAGEAYARISVEAERLGLASSAMTQAVDLPAIRERFRMLMDWPDHPQMVLRVGHPQLGPIPPPTGRRPLAAVFQFEG